MTSKIRNIRFFFVGFALLAIYVLIPPTKESLESSQATVISANQLINGRFDVQYSLDNGQVIKDYVKGSFFVNSPTNRAALMQLQGTGEKITLLHKAGKPWQIQKSNGEFILKFEDIQKRRYIFLGVLLGAMTLVGIFLPNLIKKE